MAPARLLVVHHTPSPAVHSVLEAVRSGASDPAITGVEVVASAALSTTASDVLAADGYLLGTPANLGYMSGALKHFFDTIYYPCLGDTAGRPFSYFVHGNDDVTGAVKAIGVITTGLGWRLVQSPLELTGHPDRAALDAAWELGAATAAHLAP
jgi:NAD(P)H-dependent FMN reductase